MPKETFTDKLRRVLCETVEIQPYDPRWPERFEEERRFLFTRFPENLVGRIEHFGSTAVPGLAAKPIIDMLVQVASLDRAKREIVPVLEELGYDYFWRATYGEDGPPFYAWLIRRSPSGGRTHHLHLVEAHFEHWDRLLFRDCLRTHPKCAAAYEALKRDLAHAFPADRVAYTREKALFIETWTARAKKEALR